MIDVAAVGTRDLKKLLLLLLLLLLLYYHNYHRHQYNCCLGYDAVCILVEIYQAELYSTFMIPSTTTCRISLNKCQYTFICGPDSSVGIGTELRTGRSGIKSRWGWYFPPVQTGPEAHPASCKIGTDSFQGVKCGRGVLLITHPLLVPRVMEE